MLCCVAVLKSTLIIKISSFRFWHRINQSWHLSSDSGFRIIVGLTHTHTVFGSISGCCIVGELYRWGEGCCLRQGPREIRDREQKWFFIQGILHCLYSGFSSCQQFYHNTRYFRHFLFVRKRGFYLFSRKFSFEKVNSLLAKSKPLREFWSAKR